MAIGLPPLNLTSGILTRSRLAIALSVSISLLASSCTSTPPTGQSPNATTAPNPEGAVKPDTSSGPAVKIDGSSTVFPIAEAAAESFQKAGKGRVTVGVSGTGGGFKKFCTKDGLDIVTASRPISTKEIGLCQTAGIEYIELPIAYDALTIAVNPGNDWVSDITPSELKTIWEPNSKISRWNQVRPSWPNKPIKLFGPGADSGTFDYFTEAINGKSKASRTDYTPSENDNVTVQGLSREMNGLGYFGYSYLESNRSRIKSLSVNGIAPSPKSVEDGTYKPLSRPLFIYVSANALSRPEVKVFAEYIVSQGGKFAQQAKYIAFPQKGYDLVLKHLNQRKVGTLFGGEEAVGLTIEQLMEREANP
jgi:phosphate transport system substrate-binding protein